MNIWGYLFILWAVCYLLFEYICLIQRKLKDMIKDYKELKRIRGELKEKIL